MSEKPIKKDPEEIPPEPPIGEPQLPDSYEPGTGTTPEPSTGG